MGVAPKSFTVNSTLVMQAKYVTEKEWGWKPTENIGDWLDTFIWWSMRKFGVTIDGYVIERSGKKPGR